MISRIYLYTCVCNCVITDRVTILLHYYIYYFSYLIYRTDGFSYVDDNFKSTSRSPIIVTYTSVLNVVCERHIFYFRFWAELNSSVCHSFGNKYNIPSIPEKQLRVIMKRRLSILVVKCFSVCLWAVVFFTLVNLSIYISPDCRTTVVTQWSSQSFFENTGSYDFSIAYPHLKENPPEEIRSVLDYFEEYYMLGRWGKGMTKAVALCY